VFIMGVLNRLIDMTKAAANELLDKMENPAMMLNHYVRKAQGEIETVESERAKQEAAAKNYAQQAAEFAKLADLCDTKAVEAMKAGNEAAAREALSLKLGYTEKSRELAEWQQAAAARSAELTVRLETAKAELAAMQKKKDELVARVERAEAKARTAMPSFGCGSVLQTGSAARDFQRMEEKIAQWEAHVEASARPYGAGDFTYGAGASQPAAENPARDARINEQLEQLRKRVSAE
jgi:phage shock protein A